MNGYKILEQTYRKAADTAQEQEERGNLLKKARVMEFLATCDEADRATIWDSGAMNDTLCNYAALACSELVMEKKLTANQAEEIRGRIRALLEDVTAERALKIMANTREKEAV